MKFRRNQITMATISYMWRQQQQAQFNLLSKTSRVGATKAADAAVSEPHGTHVSMVARLNSCCLVGNIFILFQYLQFC